ncbi:hypothetical protein JXM67_11795 [candidate division WOR-3 bacterium]|nr:hypothetical protein [candidate division WOR-3 bacterium]
MNVLAVLGLLLLPYQIEGSVKQSISWQAKVFEVQTQIADIHPFLANLFPIALVVGDSLEIYDIDTLKQRYVFIKREPTPFPMSTSIRASFPLACYDGRTSCIVSYEVFSSLSGYATIYHEFMHCTQWQTCELKLKEKLDIYNEAMAEQNYSWELDHPFPYQDMAFTVMYSAFLKALDEGDSASVHECRTGLKQMLGKKDYEYMVWQEWKEGFARLIENKILARMGLQENHYGTDKPYDRIVFYEGGSKLIAFLAKNEPDLLADIESLFYKMYM